jgi:hypothetical protein
MRGGRRRFGYNRSGSMLLGFLRELGRRRERENYVRRVALFILILCVFVLPFIPAPLFRPSRVYCYYTRFPNLVPLLWTFIYICICVFLRLRIARLLPPSSSSTCTELHFDHLFFFFPFRSPRSHSRFRQPDGCLNACG